MAGEQAPAGGTPYAPPDGGAAEERLTGDAVKTIGELMTPCPIAIHPEHTLAHAHSLMRAHGLRHLPVVDEDRVVGVVSLSDILLFESLRDREPDQVPVDEAMVGPPYMVWVDTPVIVVLEEMLARRLGSALVVDRVGLAKGRIAGIFTPVDAMQALKELTGEPADSGAKS